MLKDGTRCKKQRMGLKGMIDQWDFGFDQLG